jgi:apolipoprotein N-acyltransferase
MSFPLAVVNAAFAELWVCRGGSPVVRRRAAAGLLTAIVLMASALLYGWSRIRTLPAELLRPRAVPIAVLQANLDLGTQWRPDLYGENLDIYLKLTREVLEGSDPPAVVFWPESAMTFFLSDEPAYRSAIARVLHPAKVQLIAGGPRVAHLRDAPPQYFNSTFLLGPTGEVIAWQDKTKLLPFAEYFPFQRLDLLRRNFGRARQFSPGENRAALPSVAGNAGVVVCNEAMYPEPASDRVAAGAEILISPSNDSWFSSLKYSLQAFDIARLRAVEQRRYLVRASTSGPSAIVDPLGRVIEQTEPFAHARLSGGVRPLRALSVYHRIGDAFAIACGIAALLACAHGARQRGAMAESARDAREASS